MAQSRMKKYESMSRYEAMHAMIQNTFKTYHSYVPAQCKLLPAKYEALVAAEQAGSPLVEEYENVLARIFEEFHPAMQFEKVAAIQPDRKVLTKDDCPFKEAGLERSKWLKENGFM